MLWPRAGDDVADDAAADAVATAAAAARAAAKEAAAGAAMPRLVAATRPAVLALPQLRMGTPRAAGATAVVAGAPVMRPARAPPRQRQRQRLRRNARHVLQQLAPGLHGMPRCQTMAVRALCTCVR